MTPPIDRDEVLPEWVPAERFPFRSRFLALEGHRLHFVDEGRGPTLLLFHGNPTWSFLYRDIIAGLSRRFRCIAFDYPGFGLSRAAPGYDFLPASHARVAARFVDALGLGSFAVMVQDWGGPIGLHLAAQRARQVSAIIIGNTWAWPIDGDLHFEWFSRLMGGPAGRLAIRRFNAFVNVMIPLGVRRRRLEPEVMRAYRGPFPTARSRLPTSIFPREIRTSRDFLLEVEQGLAALSSKPALIVWGDRDIAFRAVERTRFEDLFPRHRTVVLRGAGHFIQEDAPGEITAAVEAWWDGDVAAGDRTSSLEERL